MFEFDGTRNLWDELWNAEVSLNRSFAFGKFFDQSFHDFNSSNLAYCVPEADHSRICKIYPYNLYLCVILPLLYLSIFYHKLIIKHWASLLVFLLTKHNTFGGLRCHTIFKRFRNILIKVFMIVTEQILLIVCLKLITIKVCNICPNNLNLCIYYL